MHDRRRLALDALRLSGGSTVDELARELRLTRTSAANHLARLRAEGLVTPLGLRTGKRRPSVIYGLSPTADSAFHQEYEKLAIDLLNEIRRRGPARVERLLRQVGDRWIARDLPAVHNLRGQSRLERAAKVMAARGFMPTLEAVGRRQILRNHNCSISRVCRAHHQAADMVKHWVEALVGSQVRRSSCICQGAPSCEYVITIPSTTSVRPSDRK